MTKVIYLNGPSSCGKTVLAQALQEVLEEPYLRIGIDKIIGFMPHKMNDWEGGYKEEGFCWVPDKDPSGHPVYTVRAGAFAKRISQSLIDIAVLLAKDYNLIIDDVSFGVDGVNLWREALKEHDVLFVGVVAPLEILEKREQERGDRFTGGARSQYFKVHENVAYDLEIDTHSYTLEENVRRILNLSS